MRKRPLIKFLSKTPLDSMAPLWDAIMPETEFDDVEFTFNPDERKYDYFVVYEDLPPQDGERKILRSERLACPKYRTILITTEPSSIRNDGLNYLAQFGNVWTSRSFDRRSKSKLAASGCYVIGPSFGPPPLRWFYGRDMDGDSHLTFEHIQGEKPSKTNDLSTVTSNKMMNHTVHAKRQNFVHALKSRMGDDLSFFGRGHHEVRDKREAMFGYRYHLAIENHFQPGHHTEKLTDCFLALSLPFYFGDPDYAKFYPEDAVISIDIFDLDQAEATIRGAIANREYEKRLPSLVEAKRIALSASNPLIQARAWSRRVSGVELREPKSTTQLGAGTIHGRHAFRRAHPLKAVKDLQYRTVMRRHPSSSPLQR